MTYNSYHWSYFVYAHCTPDEEIFYVGHGTRGRVIQSLTHCPRINPVYREVIEKYGSESIRIFILHEVGTRAEAIELEMKRIFEIEPRANRQYNPNYRPNYKSVVK